MASKAREQRGSASVQKVLKDAKASAAWDKKGMPKPGVRKGGIPGYADAGVGTPGYIRAAATRAEGLAKKIVKDFGGGKPQAARHRIPDDHYSAGKPTRGSNPAIHMTPENAKSNRDSTTADKKRLS